MEAPGRPPQNRSLRETDRPTPIVRRVFIFRKNFAMNRLTDREITLRLAVLFVLLAMAATIPLARGECLLNTPADRFAAERAGLSREWIVQLPFDSDGYRLDRVDVGSSVVVAQSGDGNVHAVQAVTSDPQPQGPAAGHLLWSTSLGLPLADLQPVGLGRDLVVVNRDMDVVGLDARNGSIFWRRRLSAPPAAGSLPVGNWVYVPLRTRVMLRLPVNPFRQPPAGTANDDPDVAASGERRQLVNLSPIEINARGLIEQQPAPFVGGVVWCTRNGHLVAIEPAKTSWVRNEFELQQPAGGPVIVQDQTVFTTTASGELIRLDDTPGGLRIVWRSLLETAVSPNANRPQMLLAGDRLIVSLGAEGIAAHAVDSGRRSWRAQVRGDLLAVVGDRVWCLDRKNILTGLNLANGTAEAFLAPGPFTVPVTNRASRRLVLASPRGLLVSLTARRVVGGEAAGSDAAQGKAGGNSPPGQDEADDTAGEPPPEKKADEPFDFFGN